MIEIAVLDDYQRVALSMADWSGLGPDCAVSVFDRNLATVDEAAQALAGFDVICLLRERMPVPAELLARLPRLKLIVVTGAHNRTLDLAAAEARGITVTHTRGGDSYYATTELALGLMIACARHLAFEDRGMRRGLWQRTVGITLHGRTLGLLGLGRMGTRMAELGRALGMRVLAWSPNLTPGRAEAGGATYADKATLFREADVVSIHLVLGERTRGLVGAAELALMKPSAFLVNTSRGPIVDEAALIAALRERRIAGAGLDVYDVEPLPPEHPLRALDNVVLSPHLGFVTEGTYRTFYQDMVECIAAWRAGAPVRLLRAA
ncbi:D-2-hydroxyacid dehydrogenase family protein [Elioraea sp.]|uniref:D-2-hydroxyacid dehydrogenase family protein n=1 Tax=Elioraea sp. TaxID=2185103 RepID=UPI00307E2B16